LNGFGRGLIFASIGLVHFFTLSPKEPIGWVRTVRSAGIDEEQHQFEKPQRNVLPHLISDICQSPIKAWDGSCQRTANGFQYVLVSNNCPTLASFGSGDIADNIRQKNKMREE
jgi:hypothetical protein